MSGNGTAARERLRHLMMAALDGEIDAPERAELERALESDPELRSEWERLGRVKEATGMVTLTEPPEEVWETYWTSVYNRLERGFGWILASLGAILLLSWGGWLLVRNIVESPQVPTVVKGGLLLLIGGGVVLFVSVVRERIFMRSGERYGRVRR